MEFELDEYLPQLCRVWVGHTHILERQRNSKILPYCHQLFRQTSHVSVFEKCFSRPLLCQRWCSGEDGFEIPEIHDEIPCSLLSDSLHTRYVIRRIANKGEVIRNTHGRNTKPYRTILDGNPLLLYARRAASSWIEQPDLRSYELLEILITRDNYDIDILLDRLPRKSPDDVISLVAFKGEYWNPIRVENLTDTHHSCIKVTLELFRQLLSGRFVRRIPLMPETRPGIVYPSEIIWSMRYYEPL